MVRRCLAVVAAGLIGLLAIPTASAQYVDDFEIIFVNAAGQRTTTFSPGEGGGLFARGLLPNNPYRLIFSQSPRANLGSATTDSEGGLVMQFRIPTTARAGSATMTLESTSGVRDSRSSAITIRAVPAVDVKLPDTGTAVDLYVGSGTVLILAGIVLLLYVRRRRAFARMHAGSDQHEAASAATRS